MSQTFEQAGRKYENDRRQYVADNTVKIEKQQLNLLVPKAIANSLKTTIQNMREEYESQYYEGERKRLALEFESTNPAPHAKDY